MKNTIILIKEDEDRSKKENEIVMIIVEVI